MMLKTFKKIPKSNSSIYKKISNETISVFIKKKGIIQSITRKGNCLIMHIEKTSLEYLKLNFYIKKFRTIEELKNEITT